ncbi:oligoendopeptidase F [Lacticaseibacillus sharpeae]|uniref:Oligopeptidase F n=1 Tax=Lacticaseibacillus sharpeae JCM 1186 = DSM 20505 TaxID=1291052 RepID=A0A0R1ZP52_9LACO|nr:oligoendopeptidase F [Lacticaseibacillus sharpeae]KRM54932.1 oligoendopeptidase F [Lacticaseibacillus sharpeae JCM 1186 = DSM 20505]
MVEALPARSDVPTDLTWDLSSVFPSDDAWAAAFTEVGGDIDKIKAVAGTLGNSSSALIAGVNTILGVFRKLEKVYVYASMKSDQDTANSQYQAMSAKAKALAVKVESAAAFSDPEILAIPEATLQDWLAKDDNLKPYTQFLTKITAKRDHTLDADTEALLASAGDALDASAATFNQLNNSDIEFGMVEDEDGKFVQLSHGIYGELIRSSNQEVRHNAFDTMYEAYDGMLNTFAATLSGQVKAHNFTALAHKYPNARAAALAGNNIPESVYSTLIDQVNAHLPLLHRYVALRKKILGLDELHSYDLYVPITGEAPLSYTIDEAKAEGEKALAPLGSDYLKHVHHIFNDRVIDFIENKNKRSGAYSGGSYDTDAFILHNWHDSLDALYTLVHETGHSVHSEYTRGTQPYMYGDYPIFVAEIASTSNEALLTDYLLKTQTDPKVRAYVLNYYLDGFKGTLFRQTQFAEFEHWIHQQDQAGQPLTADTMSDFYGDLNARYYGDALERDDAISLEWARIPHFYYNYYVYQYATGFAAANALTSHIISGQDGAVDKYLGFLKSGSSKFAIDTMKAAGVDMTKPDYLEDAFKVFEARLNEFEQLVAKL